MEYFLKLIGQNFWLLSPYEINYMYLIIGSSEIAKIVLLTMSDLSLRQFVDMRSFLNQRCLSQGRLSGENSLKQYIASIEYYKQSF